MPRKPYSMSDSLWVVYILQLSNGIYYTGITNNLARRLKMHASGHGSKLVRALRPFILVYTERAENRSSASKREIEIKRLSRREKIKLVRNNNETIKYL
ncbi:MAG: GIY-YIG nuclease family protein [Patescibacteria group bacterium]